MIQCVFLSELCVQKQSETEALVKSAPAFPVAHVAVLLFNTHAKFLDVLMARFAKKCPYVTPMYIPKADVSHQSYNSA